MNPMAAMYHIAQKDPPTLKEPHEWYISDNSFVKILSDYHAWAFYACMGFLCMHVLNLLNYFV